MKVTKDLGSPGQRRGTALALLTPQPCTTCEVSSTAHAVDLCCHWSPTPNSAPQSPSRAMHPSPASVISFGCVLLYLRPCYWPSVSDLRPSFCPALNPTRLHRWVTMGQEYASEGAAQGRSLNRAITDVIPCALAAPPSTMLASKSISSVSRSTLSRAATPRLPAARLGMRNVTVRALDDTNVRACI